MSLFSALCLSVCLLGPCHITAYIKCKFIQAPHEMLMDFFDRTETYNYFAKIIYCHVNRQECVDLELYSRQYKY